jgi:3-isopropylmalate/(R)-2-methylmalate dehydratase small subunit
VSKPVKANATHETHASAVATAEAATALPKATRARPTDDAAAPDMTISGRAWVFGDNMDTDVIIPARYLLTSDPVALAPHCMEDFDASFATTVQPGDIIVAGNNFGCGSSREHAPIAIKGVGVAAVIAVSFANIFYRNSINIGLPIFECPEAAQAVAQGEMVSVNLETGRIVNTTTGAVYNAQAYPPSILRIIRAGGLVAATREKFAQRSPSAQPAATPGA